MPSNRLKDEIYLGGSTSFPTSKEKHLSGVLKQRLKEGRGTVEGAKSFMAAKKTIPVGKPTYTSEEGLEYPSYKEVGKATGSTPEAKRLAQAGRITIKAAKKGVNVPVEQAERLVAKSALRGMLAKRLLGRLPAIGQLLTLPSQIEEYKEMMKPLHKREGERAGRKA